MAQAQNERAGAFGGNAGADKVRQNISVQRALGGEEMLHRVETTDPITRRDVRDPAHSPFFIERGAESELKIYFESEETKRQYLDIPIERPIEHRLNLDNPTDVMIDEG